VSSCPALSRFAAMPDPMFPSPINPTFISSPHWFLFGALRS
jgi:hypothetical protein